jgi:23S rRNA pseudouridine2605 synthase
VIAARGVSSRRSAEDLITGGHVSVNGQVITELGTRVDPVSAEIRIDGKLLKPQILRTVLLNKPSGYITTMSDERDRRTVMELVQTRERLFPVGRLDRDTEGLLLLTNDGDLANRIMHPRYKLAKEYHVVTPTRPSDRILQRIRDGVTIDGRMVVPDEIRLLRETPDGIVIKLVIHEGFYHAVRRLMDAANIPVKRLRRHRIGPISIQGVAQGEWRELTPGELTQLAEAVHLDREDDRPSVVPATEKRAERSRPAAVEARRDRPRDQPGTGRPRDQRPGDRDQAQRPGQRDQRPGDRPRDAGGRDSQPQRPAAAGPRRDDTARRPAAPPRTRPERPASGGDENRPTSTTGPAPRRVRPLQRERQDAPSRTVTRPATAGPTAAPSGSPRVEVGSGRFEMVGGRRTDGVTREYRPFRPAAGEDEERPVQPMQLRPGGPGERQRPGSPPRDGQRGDAGRRDTTGQTRAVDLDTVGRRSRHRVTDDPDATPKRIKRRSPHPHSHRGRKPKPAAAPINTTMKKTRDIKKSRGGSRGRRR